jgi:endonuclease III
MARDRRSRSCVGRARSIGFSPKRTPMLDVNLTSTTPFNYSWQPCSRHSRRIGASTRSGRPCLDNGPTRQPWPEADRTELEEIIRPTGFFRAKTDHLLGLSAALVEHHHGRVPDDLESLVKLPGVGRKTALVVLGNAFDQPGITADTHFMRLSERFGWLADNEVGNPIKIEKAVGELFEPRDWTMLSHRVIWHGRRRCHAQRPACGACPVSNRCVHPLASAQPILSKPLHE